MPFALTAKTLLGRVGGAIRCFVYLSLPMRSSIFLFCLLWVGAFWGQTALHVLPAQNLAKYRLPKGNYSALAALGEGVYAVVDDKSVAAGFQLWHIVQDSLSGALLDLRVLPTPQPTSEPAHDPEALAFVPQRNTLFMAHEATQTIAEYDRENRATGFCLQVPPILGRDNIQPNRGFEALTYDAVRQRLWACTESALRSDTLRGRRVIRLQGFTLSGQASEQYIFLADSLPRTPRTRHQVQGVSALLALPTGDLLCLERDLRILRYYCGATARSSLSVLQLSPQKRLDATESRAALTESLVAQKALTKRHLATFATQFNLWKNNFANYEALAMGIRLKDGRQTLLLLNDSQARLGRLAWHLKDFLQVVILPTWLTQ